MIQIVISPYTEFDLREVEHLWKDATELPVIRRGVVGRIGDVEVVDDIDLPLGTIVVREVPND